MDISGLAAEINRQLELYAEHTEETVRAIGEKAAQEGAQKLRNTSPRRTGKYAASWDYKQIKHRDTKRFVVYNKEHYRLTHLIEKSHALRNGGRSTAQPHIKPVEQEMIQNFEADLRRGLST